MNQKAARLAAKTTTVLYMTMSVQRSTMNAVGLRKLPFPAFVHICVTETRQCDLPANGHFRGGTLVLSRLVPSRSSQSSFPIPSSLSFSSFDSSMALSLAFLSCSRFSTLPAYLGLVWHEQVQPGTVQS